MNYQKDKWLNLEFIWAFNRHRIVLHMYLMSFFRNRNSILIMDNHYLNTVWSKMNWLYQDDVLMTSAFKWIYEQWKRIFGICFLKGSSGLSNQIIRDEFKKLWRRAKKRIEQEYGSHLYQYASGFCFNRTIFVTAETRDHQRWNNFPLKF